MSRSALIDELDEVLLDVRHLFRTPEFRRLLLASIADGVELSTLRLLRAVERHHGGPSVRDIAESLGVDPSTASRLVDNAARRGLLARERRTDDARRARLGLTEAGATVLTEANGVRRELLARVTSDWSADETTSLIRLLRVLRDSFDRL
ncbi:MAG TPA: MarR family transcriptional regulator [Acidimicrobiia bacterium]|nr:MarR family transcriptional regulator [Acidimicrobiia bacterium]